MIVTRYTSSTACMGEVRVGKWPLIGNFVLIVITGCAVAQHCCNDDQQSQWGIGELTPCRSETPEIFIIKIGYIDYVAGGNTHAKFYGNRPRGVRPTNSQNITSCDFVYLHFPSLPFPFLPFPFLFSCRRLQQQESRAVAGNPRDAAVIFDP